MADNIKVNFSTEEVESETRAFLPVPPGFYKCAITKIEEKAVSSNEKGNFGKPFWSLTLVAQEGQFTKRHFFANVMLFDGALHTAAQLLKAVGMGDALKKGSIPSAATLVSKVVDVNVVRIHDKRAEAELRELGENSSVFKNDVRGFRAVGSAAADNGKQSLLP